jgi:hypothetical protein
MPFPNFVAASTPLIPEHRKSVSKSLPGVRAFEIGFVMADALAVHCRPLEETRGPNSSCQWLAECDVDGRRFAARSRQGAVYELARMLVAAGIENRPLCVTFTRVAGQMTWGSCVAVARWTLTEGAATPLRRRRWRNFDARLERVGKNSGVEFSASFSPSNESAPLETAAGPPRA